MDLAKLDKAFTEKLNSINKEELLKWFTMDTKEYRHQKAVALNNFRKYVHQRHSKGEPAFWFCKNDHVVMSLDDKQEFKDIWLGFEIFLKYDEIYFQQECIGTFTDLFGSKIKIK